MLRRAQSLILAGLAAASLLLSGCYPGNIDQYFSLPKPAEEYRQLQELIDREIASGSEYAAPTRGSFRQSVQLSDVNADGRDEAFAFFRESGGALKINVYTLLGQEYRQVLSLRGEGRSIGNIGFADMDADGTLELIVTWQLASGLSLLSVYALDNWSGRQLLSSDCSEFVTGDMNGDGRSELVIIRSSGAEGHLADMYAFERGAEPRAVTAALSSGIAQIQRLQVSAIAGGYPALAAESLLRGGELVTDLLVLRDGSLVNLTLNQSTGVSGTRRSYTLLATQDIDGDGAVEIPHPQQLYSASDEVFWSIAWYRYDVSGRAYQVLTTYHCITDGWYLVLPSGWDVGLTVRRDDSVPGEHAVFLSQLRADGSASDLLAVYAISGENRADRARMDGRFVLAEDLSTVYAARLFSDQLNKSGVESRFHIIYAEWSAGSF